MASKQEPTVPHAEPDLVITRVFNVPRSVVFKAWIDPKILAQWWGPEGFTNPVCELDSRPGGSMYIDMGGPDGTIYPMSGTFQEIIEPEMLSFISAPLDKNGNPIFEVLTTVTFTESGGKTTLNLQAKVVRKTAEAEQYLVGMNEGWTQSLNRLEKLVQRLYAGNRS